MGPTKLLLIPSQLYPSNQTRNQIILFIQPNKKLNHHIQQNVDDHILSMQDREPNAAYKKLLTHCI